MLRARRCSTALRQDASALRRRATSFGLLARQSSLLYDQGYIGRHEHFLHLKGSQHRSYAGFFSSAERPEIPWMSLKERLAQQSRPKDDVEPSSPVHEDVPEQPNTPLQPEDHTELSVSQSDNKTARRRKKKSQAAPSNANHSSTISSRVQNTKEVASKGHSQPRKSKQGAKDGKQASKNTADRNPPNKATAKVSPQTLMPARLELEAIDEEYLRKAVPRMGHSLDRVLFNPGVHMLQDPRTQVFNFDPYLATIPTVEDFDFEALGEYITSSRDTKLRELCAKHDKKYCGSTSSLTGILSHFHYLLSAWRPINFGNVSRSWQPDSPNFTQMTRLPAAAFLHHENGRYAIDGDKEYDKEHILSTLGRSLEKFLILPKQDFDRYQVTRSHEISEAERNEAEAYHYSVLGDFLIRSQLDAQDPRLPGTGVFDIKTRAALTIRMNVSDYRSGQPYEVYKNFGQWDSFEREYVDMMRSTFLKYSLQVRMGRMDGIFVAYHNTERIFGFQYVPLAELDHCLHGTEDQKLGDEEFRVSVKLFNDLLDKATERFPGQTLRLHVETIDTLLLFFAEPVTDKQMQSIQQANKTSLAASAQEVVDDLREIRRERQASILKEAQEHAESTETVEPDDVWDEISVHLETLTDAGTIGREHVRAVVANIVKSSKIMQGALPEDIDEAVSLLVESLINPTYYRKPNTPRLESDESSDVTTEEQLQMEEAESESNVESDHASSKSQPDESLDEDISVERAGIDILGTASGLQADNRADSDSLAAEIIQSDQIHDRAILSDKSDPRADDESSNPVDALCGPGIGSTEIPIEAENDESLVIVASDRDATDKLGELTGVNPHEIVAEKLDESDKHQSEVLAITQAFLDKDLTTAGSSVAEGSRGSESNVFDGMATSRRSTPSSPLDEHVSRLGDLLANVTNEIEGQQRRLRPFENMFALMKADSSRKSEPLEESNSSNHSADALGQTGSEASHNVPKDEPNSSQLLALQVSVTNLVDGKTVKRPAAGYKQWHCQYKVKELTPERAAACYASTKHKRKVGMMNMRRPLRQKFAQTLRQAADRGRAHRASITLAEQKSDVIKVAWDDAGLQSSTPVFK